MSKAADDITHTTAPSIAPVKQAGGGPSAYVVVISGPSFGEMYKLKGARSVLGRGDRADVRVLDDGISREHAAIEREEGKPVLVDLHSTNGTFCNGERISRRDLADGDKISIGASTILKFTYQDQADESYQRQLFESALRDGLTATFNRRYFIDRLHTEMRFAIRHSKPLTLLFIDIDHFKRVNDTYGHQAGDRVLADVSHALAGGIRAEDVLARYGGEEFAVICREVEEEGARIVAERLRKTIEAMVFEHEGQKIPVTISIGAVVGRNVEDPQVLIRAADAAMYEAKRGGRNRVALAG